MSDTPINESHLVDALEPFRGFVLSTMIFLLQQSGLEEDLLRGGTVADICKSHGWDQPRTAAVADYLVAAGLASRDAGGVLRLTERTRRYGEARAWYEMMIGGYGRTFLSLSEHLEIGSAPTPRNGGWVGSGSCGISQHDAVPLLRRLLAETPSTEGQYRRLVDLGCGSGVYLTELCRDYPGLTAVGLEPDPDGAAAARAWVAKEELTNRIDIAQHGALDWLSTVGDQPPDLAVLAFVIHEVLGQEGENGVRRLLTSLFEASPGLTLAIIDIDLGSSSKARMAQPLAQSYYNAYFLMHPFTSQRLESREWWEQLFRSCQLEAVAFGTTDPAMDSTGFEVGWLLRREQ